MEYEHIKITPNGWIEFNESSENSFPLNADEVRVFTFRPQEELISIWSEENGGLGYPRSFKGKVSHELYHFLSEFFNKKHPTKHHEN